MTGSRFAAATPTAISSAPAAGTGTPPRPDRPARRPRRMVDDADHRQRLCELRQQRDRLPGRLSAGAAFRRRRRSGGQLRRHRLRHRPRDQPSFRRPGQQFRPDGRLAIGGRTTTSPASERTRRLVAQYGAYEPLPGLNIRAEQTLGEDIADNAGLAIAYDAYRLSLGGRPAPVIDGLTGDQRFFMGRAQVNGRVPRGGAAPRIALSDSIRRASCGPSRCATTTPGTRLSASGPVMPSICPPSSACGSGSRLRA